MHKENQFTSSQSFILWRIRSKVLLYAKCGDSFAAQTGNGLLITLSSFNMYFINLFSHFNSHRCRLNLVGKQQPLFKISTSVLASAARTLSSARQLHPWHLPHRGRWHWLGSEVEVMSIRFGIILPRYNLSLAQPMYSRQNRVVVFRALLEERDSWRRNTSREDTWHPLLPEDLGPRDGSKYSKIDSTIKYQLHGN